INAGRLTVQNILSRGMYFAPGGSGSIVYGLEVASDYYNSTWVMLRDSTLRLYLSRWSPTFANFYGYANLSGVVTYNDVSTQFLFDDGTNRLYIYYPGQSIYYLALNPTLNANLILSGPTFFADLNTISASSLGSNQIWLNQGLIAFGVGSSGEPWLTLQYQTYLGVNSTFWAHLYPNSSVIFANESVFGYPLGANNSAFSIASMQAAPWGDMAIISNSQVLVRTCQEILDVCSNEA